MLLIDITLFRFLERKNTGYYPIILLTAVSQIPRETIASPAWELLASLSFGICGTAQWMQYLTKKWSPKSMISNAVVQFQLTGDKKSQLYNYLEKFSHCSIHLSQYELHLERTLLSVHENIIQHCCLLYSDK